MGRGILLPNFVATPQGFLDSFAPLRTTSLLDRHGLRPPHFAFSCDWGHRTSLFVGRSRRRFWLYRNDGALGSYSPRHPAHRVSPQHSRRIYRRLSILASGPFLLGTFLAVRAAFNSGGLPWRLSAVACRGVKNINWDRAAFFGRALDLSPQRSAGRRASSQSDSDRCWSGNRIPVRPHWNGRRNISHSPSAVLPLGAHSPGGRSLGVIYFGKLNFGANRLLYREPIYSVAWSSPRTGGGDWGRSGFTSRQPPFSHPHHLDLVGDSPGHRRTEVALHKVGAIDSIARGGGSVNRPYLFNLSFGARVGDHGFILKSERVISSRAFLIILRIPRTS